MNGRRIVGAVLRKWWFLGLMMGVFGLLGVVITQASPPVYSAVVTMYSIDLSKLQAEGAQLEFYDIELSREVLKQFSDVIYTRRVTDVVIAQLPQYQLEEKDLLTMVRMESSIDANIFTVSAKSEDPVKAEQVANAMAEQFALTIHELLNTENVGVLDRATVPQQAEPKNLFAMAFLGGVAGFMVGFSIIYLLEYFNAKVYSLDDLEEPFRGAVLGSVPGYQTIRKGAEGPWKE